jgi:hypothetical protein
MFSDYVGGGRSFDGVTDYADTVDSYAIAPYWEARPWHAPLGDVMPAIPSSPPPADWEQGADDFWTGNMLQTWGVAEYHPFRAAVDGIASHGDQQHSIFRGNEAEAWGVEIATYEGGSGWLPDGVDVATADYRMWLHDHWRTYEFTENLMEQALYGNGTTGINGFTWFNTPWFWRQSPTEVNFWGIADGDYDRRSNQWRAYVDYAHRHNP